MSSIHYKFSSSTEFKHVTFDGLSISLLDLKKAIMEKQKLKSTELDLHITNANTLQVYKDESTLIPKNAAVLVRRIPLGPVRDSKIYVVKRNESSVTSSSSSTKAYHENDAAPKLSLAELSKTSNLAAANASEDDKIKAAIAQSTIQYDQSNFVRPPRYGTYKYPNSSASAVSSQIRCFRCNQQGHYSSQCPLPKTEAARQHHHATGIPRSHMIEVNKESKGAMLTTDGRYVVPVMDKKGYDIGKKERPPFIPAPVEVTQEEDEEEPIPDELICLLCKDLLVDAVVIPCCGNSYCDECIRNALLDSDNHQCPTCHKANISPDSLIANKFLRQAVNKFKNDTGIAKKRSNAPVWPRPAPTEAPKSKPTPPMKVSYGPSSRDLSTEHRQTGNSGYVVKATSNQVVASKTYNLAKRAPEGGSGSPRDPNQPIRIKLGKSEEPAADVASKESTPSEPKMQSTPIETASLPSSTPSDSYTFNSTPDSSEPKVKVNTSEPLPPGISPPTVKVVRPLVEETSSVVEQPSGRLTGIQPLEQSTQETESGTTEDFKDFSIRVEHQSRKISEPLPKTEEEEELPKNPEDNNAKPEDNDAKPPVTIETEINSPSHPVENDLHRPDDNNSPMPHDEDIHIPQSQPDPIPPSKPIIAPPIVVHHNIVSEHSRSTPPPVQNILPPPQNVLPPSHLSIPPPMHPPPPTSLSQLPPSGQAIPGLIPGLPPLPHQVTNPDVTMYQRPPPTFPFHVMIPPPALGPTPFSQPPPGFPPHPVSLPPPPGMAIPSLAKMNTTAVIPPPPGSEATLIPTIKTSTSSDRHMHGRGRSPARNERSPRKRTERRGNKSKLDIMSDEFAEKLKQRSSPRRRSRSSSGSYSSKSSRSASYSSYSSQSSSSYSSYSASTWTSSSYSRSFSRSPPPRRRKRKRPTKRVARGRRRGSDSWSDRSSSPRKKRRSRSYSRKKQSRRERSPQKRDRMNERSYSPQRKSSYPGRGRRRSFERNRKSYSPHRNENDAARPLIPVITRTESSIPGLPTKEVADFERDQALYAHYRQTYERDWYERGIMPPPPYDRFIQSRYSKSPSPPGTGPTMLPSNQPPIQNSVLITPMNVLPPQGHPHPPSFGMDGQPWNNQRFPPPHYIEQPGQIHRHMDFGGDGDYYTNRSVRDRNAPPPSRSFDPKEEQYRMQLSPRSRQRFDVERQQHQYRDTRRREDYARDSRYSDHRRRNERVNYDDYRARKRSRNYPRDVSSDRGQTRIGKRNKMSPRQDLEEGDGTPVRDERPLPDDLEPIERVRSSSKRGDDFGKMGKKPRREGRKPESERGKDSSKLDRKEDQSKKAFSKSSRGSKSVPSSKLSKRKSDQVSEGGAKVKKSESMKRSKSSKSSKNGEGRNKEKTSKQRANKMTSPRNDDDQENSTPDPASIPMHGVSSGDKGAPSSTAGGTQGAAVVVDSSPAQAKSTADDTASVSEHKRDDQVGNKLHHSTSEEPREKTVEDSLDSGSPIKPSRHAQGDEQNKVKAKTNSRDKSTKLKATKSRQETKTTPSIDSLPPPQPTTVPGEGDLGTNPKEVENAIDSSISKPGLNPDSRKVSRKRKPGPSTESTSGREKRLGKAEERKLVEYDGSGPAPTGDELVKITIPKSKWEKSDDEGKEVSDTRYVGQRVAKPHETKATVKGRRIKIKRNPPSLIKEAAKEVEADDRSPASHKEIKPVTTNRSPIVENEPPIKDARMVITLRRNSKLNDEKQGRRVSMGNPDESNFEPDYSDEEPQDHHNSQDKNVTSLKGKAVKATGMRPAVAEDADALVLSDYSNLSNTESDKHKKASKKKKKKKKKHKIRSQDSADITTETNDDVYNARSRSSDVRGHGEEQDYEERTRERRHHGEKDQIGRHKRDDAYEERLRQKPSRNRMDHDASPGKHHRSHDRARRSQNRDRERVSRERHHDRNQSQKHKSRHEERMRAHDSPERSRDKPRDKKHKKEKRSKRRQRRESIDAFSSGS